MSKGVKELVDAITNNVNDADIIEAIAVANICASILEKRVELNMSQKEFAEYMGISQSEVSKYENGESSFKISILAKIAAKLGLSSIEQLVGEKRKTKLSLINNPIRQQESFWNNNYKMFKDERIQKNA